jgi:hypothetical protein
MAGLEVLPADLRSRSLSPREPVFVLDDALEALALYETAGWAQLGWETWLTYPGGRIGHAPTRTLDLEQGRSEAWHEFVRRSHDVCVETIQATQRDWDAGSHNEGEVLHFCLTPRRPG